jgi:hypothetical protein
MMRLFVAVCCRLRQNALPVIGLLVVSLLVLARSVKLVMARHHGQVRTVLVISHLMRLHPANLFQILTVKHKLITAYTLVQKLEAPLLPVRLHPLLRFRLTLSLLMFRRSIQLKGRGCPKGTVSLGIDSTGGSICGGSGTSPATPTKTEVKQPTQTTSNPDGSTTKVDSITRTNSDGSSTTTTTTTTTGADGKVTKAESSVTSPKPAGAGGGGGKNDSSDDKKDDFCCQKSES